MRYYEDFEIGGKYISRGRTITEGDIVNFAMFTGDWYPLHVDVEYAKKSRFGERIAHGFMIPAVASGLIPIYEEAIVALYALENIKYHQPTKIGDTLHIEIEYTKKEELGEKHGIVDNSITVMNQRGQAVVTFVLRGLYNKKGMEIGS